MGQSMTYYTNYSIKDTIGLLKRKNIYDTLTYKLEVTEQGMFIIFTGRNTRYCYCGILHSKYAITFSRMGEGTIVSLDFISQSLVLPFPLIPEWIDEFMDKKLDAKRYRLNDRTSCGINREEKATDMHIEQKNMENTDKVKVVCFVLAVVSAAVVVGLLLSAFFIYILIKNI